MPYLFWQEGDRFQRWELEDGCCLGRDPESCDIAFPEEDTVSRVHARIHRDNKKWYLQDPGSTNGTLLNGLPLSLPSGNSLEDGDEICLGEVRLKFSIGFPGLDATRFAERVGDVFSEFHPEPSHTLILVQSLELMHRSTETLLKEHSASSLIRTLLDESVKLFNAERGFLVMVDLQGAWQTVHRIGDIQENTGLSHSVLRYVSHHRTGVMSNGPMEDPRFNRDSLLVLHKGALMCAPMETEGKVQGLLYLDRVRNGRPFLRFDLALFQAFVRQGALALRHTQLAQRAMGQAELQGELLRLQTLNDRLTQRFGEVIHHLGTSLNWLESYGDQALDSRAMGLLHQVKRMRFMLEGALGELLLEPNRDTPASMALDDLHGMLEPGWRALLAIRDAELLLPPPPSGSIWMAGSVVSHAVSALVEPMFMKVGSGQTVQGQWVSESGAWVLKLQIPQGVHPPVPDAWTTKSLHKVGVVWRYADQCLSLHFPKDLETMPDPQALPLLGLVTEEHELMGFFQNVADAAMLALFPLEESPPLPPLPHFRYLVVDALGVADVPKCIQAYRRHPNFATVPILVIRAEEEAFPALLAAGATDWLPKGFHWETLHHRLQVLKGHDELQRKALAAERLESFRQMAGSLKHEINNPLAIISMQVELLERKYPEEPKHAKILEMVERIQSLLQVLQKMREAPLEEYPGGSRIVKLS